MYSFFFCFGQKLTEQERKGSLILAITAVCRKLQTEKEKILPWPDSTLGGDKDVAPVPYEEAMDVSCVY